MMETKTTKMEIRHLLTRDDKRVNVGEWDWETYEAHKCGTTKLSQAELMKILKKQGLVERVQQEAREDAMLHARRLAVVIDNFLSDTESDQLALQLCPLLQPTRSPTLHNLVLNYTHDSGASDERTAELLKAVSDRLFARLNELGSAEDEAGRALLRELGVAPEWSCRDYHVLQTKQGGEYGEMEMRLSAMSDYVRVMRYSALEPDDQHHPPLNGERETNDDGDFATDPRNAHHDGRNRRSAGDSFVTALLYLNSEGESRDGGDGPALQGGHTLFLSEDGQPVARVAPRKGSLLLFDHHLYHRGARVLSGDKVCLRSDLLYSPVRVRTGEPMAELIASE